MRLKSVSQYRAEIYGFSALWIVLFDDAIYGFAKFWEFPFAHQVESFLRIGNVGADIFMFLSGISLYFAWTKKPPYAQYMKRRLLRVLPPAALIFGSGWFLQLLVFDHQPKLFLAKMTFQSFWFIGNTAGEWYVCLLVILYALYPLIFNYLFGSERGTTVRFLLILVMSLIGYSILYAFNPEYFKMVSVALARVPIFLTGCYLGKYVYENRQVSSIWWAPISFGAVVFAAAAIGSNGAWWWRLCFAFGGVALSYLIAALFGLIKRYSPSINRFFAFTGGFSLELYATHLTLVDFADMFGWPAVGHPLRLIFLTILSFPFAYGVSLLSQSFARWVDSKELPAKLGDSAVEQQ